MKINILVCDDFSGYLPFYIRSYASMFTRLFNSVHEGVKCQIYDIRFQMYPEELHLDEIYLLTGTSAEVHQFSQWRDGLISYIRYVHAKKGKLVGFDFGHLIIAEALGGKIEQLDKGWRMGVNSSKVVSPKAARYFPDGVMNLHYNQREQVTELPPKAEVFAQSDLCPVDGYMIGNHILAFQGHPEYTASYSKNQIMTHHGEDVSLIRKALDSLDTIETNGEQAAKWILSLQKKKK